MANTIKIADLYIREAKLRDAQVDDPAYKEVSDSIRQYGVLQPVLVRIGTDPEGNTVKELIDGTQRVSICKELNIEEVPYRVLDGVSDERALVIQYIANANRVEPKKAQYANQIQRLLDFDKTLSVNTLAVKLNKSPQTLKDILKLTKLVPKAQALVDEGQICLQNARVLSKMPATEQESLISDAVTQTPDVFVTQVAEMARQLKEQAAQGGPAPEPTFNDKAALRKLGEIEEFMENRDKVAQLLNGATDAFEGARLAFLYVINKDPATLAARKADWEAKRAASKAKVEAAKAERKAKKEAEDAAKEAARLAA